jgi:hypothetical protein
MAAKLTRLAHKIAIKLHLVAAIPFAILAPGGQSGNFWIYSPIFGKYMYSTDIVIRDITLQTLKKCFHANICHLEEICHI